MIFVMTFLIYNRIILVDNCWDAESFFFHLSFFSRHPRAHSRACCTAATAAAEKPHRTSFEEVSPVMRKLTPKVS